MTSLFNLLWIFLSVMLAAVGQLLLKKGMMAYGAVSMAKIWAELVRVFMVPYVVFGLISFVSSAILWLSIVSRNDVTYAYPMASLGYVVVLIVSAIWFNEPVTSVRVLGVLLICLGVFAITRT